MKHLHTHIGLCAALKGRLTGITQPHLSALLKRPWVSTVLACNQQEHAVPGCPSSVVENSAWHSMQCMQSGCHMRMDSSQTCTRLYIRCSQQILHCVRSDRPWQGWQVLVLHAAHLRASVCEKLYVRNKSFAAACPHDVYIVAPPQHCFVCVCLVMQAAFHECAMASIVRGSCVHLKAGVRAPAQQGNDNDFWCLGVSFRW